MLRSSRTFRIAAVIGALTIGAGCTSLLGDFNEGPGGGADAGLDGTAIGDGGPPDAIGPDSAADAGPSSDGACGTVGMTCTPASCQSGVFACDGGAESCEHTGNALDGTSCDAGAVCADGTCVACAVGTDCTEAGSCQKATIACMTGSPVCTPAGNVSDGTSCGTNLYCDNGVCQACTNGAGCTPTSNACHEGTVSCSGGQATCTDTGNPMANGAACGTNEVCDNGACVACTAGTACNPSGNPCLVGQTSCASGSAVCESTGNAPNTTSCGTNEVCTNGVCGCASGLTSCNGSCVNETSDNGNCGACGHGCLGGTCSAGVCHPVTLVTASSTTDTIAIAVDATNVYWAGGSNVFSCPVSGGPAHVVYTVPAGGSNVAQGIALPTATSPYNAFVYTAVTNLTTNVVQLAQIQKSNLAATLLPYADGLFPAGLAFDSTDSWVYDADQGECSDAFLARAKPDGTQPSTVLNPTGTTPGEFSSVQGINNPAIDSQFVYLSNRGLNAVYYCPLAGSCSSSNVALSIPTPVGVYSDGTNLWATAVGSSTTATGAVYKCAAGTACGTPTPIAAGQFEPEGIVSDGTSVFWSNNGSGELMRCPVAGCNGNPTTYVTGATGITSLAQDSVAVYWSDTTGIRRVAK